jgi:predicted deacetylase
MLKRVVVSVHDVSPKFDRQLKKILTNLADLGVKKKEMLLVPHWNGGYRLEKDGKLIRLLKNEIKHGAVLASHGFTHYLGDRKILDAFLFGGKYSNESEFSKLEYGSAVKRIKKEILILNRFFKRKIKLFVPPRWQCDRDSYLAARDLGFSYSESSFFMRNLKKDTKKLSLVVCFDFGENRFLNWFSKIYARFFIFFCGIFSLPLRFAIHPNDLGNGNFEFEIKLLRKMIQNGWILSTSEEIWSKKNET